MARRLVVVAIALLAGGCMTLHEASVGYAHSYSNGGRAVAFQLRYAEGSDDLLGELSVRGRAGADVQVAGLSTGVYVPLWVESRVHPHVALGSHVFQIGRVDGDFAFGTASPWIETGLDWLVTHETRELASDSPWGMEGRAGALPVAVLVEHAGWALSLSADLQYDVYVTHQDNDLVWSARVGLGWVTRVERRLTPVPPALGPF